MKTESFALDWPSHLLLEVGGLYEFGKDVVLVISLSESEFDRHPNQLIYLNSQILCGEQVKKVLLAYYDQRIRKFHGHMQVEFKKLEPPQ